MSEYAWMCLNKQDYEYALRPKYAKTLLRQSSEYGRVIRALYGGYGERYTGF